MRRSCGVCRTIQTTFRDWDELNRGYLEGYTRWAFRSGHSQNMIDFRRRIQKDLQTREDSPYRLNWHLPLDPEYWVRRGRMEKNMG